jgi:hypothetical protein
MLDTDVVKLVEEILGVDAANNGPFDPKVVCHLGGKQKLSVGISRDLSVRRSSALICTIKFSGTFSKIIAGINVGIAHLLARLEGHFASSKNPGTIIRNFYLADASILFYNTPIEKQKEVMEELGRRNIDSLFIHSYTHINSLFGNGHSAQSTKPLAPTIAERIGVVSKDNTAAPRRGRRKK